LGGQRPPPKRGSLSRRNSVCLILTLLFLVFSASLLSSQVTGILHAFHDPDTTDALHGFCVTSGTVACPSFHFYLATSGNVAVYDAKVDFVLIEELTDAHLPQRWLWDGEHLPDPYSCYAFCTRLPQGQVGAVQCLWVSEWWVGLVMHNADYRVTVQWRYWEFVMRSDDPIDAELIEHGPFQTSITINVQNLVVTPPDETKVLKWDPVRGIADTSFSYSLECAQRKWCQVKVSIYTTDGMKVYEEWLEQIAPGSYGFVWDGSVNVVPPPPPPDGKAPAGLYVFDIEVIGIAPGYDEDRIQSEALYVGEHEVYFLAYGNDVQSSYSVPASGPVQAWYLLRGAYQASQALVEVYDPNFQKVISVSGTTKTISETALPRPEDWNIVDFSLSTSEPASFYPYTFLFWAWDGCWTYKNHRPKTTFNNWRLRSYTAAHFMAPSSFQLTSHQKAVKELRGVRFWRWHQQLRRYVPMRRDYGEHWWWTDPANTAPPNSPTNSPSLHKQPCALHWDANLIFRALECTSVVSLFAHGDPKGIGPSRRTKITPQDLERYKDWWYWSPLRRQWLRAQGLGHLRLVLLLGCNTGGIVSPPIENPYTVRIEPQRDTLAHTFVSLGVQCVIYAAGSDIGSGRQIGPMMDEWASRFWEIATKQSADSVARAVELALKEIRDKIKKTGEGRLGMRTTFGIFVVGDTRLY
jgi:hypothetical protein